MSDNPADPSAGTADVESVGSEPSSPPRRRPRQRVPEGPAPAPAVQRLRLRYAKRGRLRFASTRDFQRALERAVRRADLPMAFSAGFHPHPRISYANAAATGSASEAEYVEIQVTERLDPDRVRIALDAALPEGFAVLEVVEAVPGRGGLADRLEASEWTLEFRDTTPEEVDEAVAALLRLEHAEVSRMMKSGRRTFDVRAAIVAAHLVSATAHPAGCAILRVVVRHTTPAVRPDDVLTALHSLAGLPTRTPPLVTRLAQGPLDSAVARVADPLAADLDAGGA